MKTTTFLAAILLTSQAALGAGAARVFHVTGWSCDGCGKKTVLVLKRVPGVTDATADVASGTLRITIDDAVFDEKLAKQAVSELGYQLH